MIEIKYFDKKQNLFLIREILPSDKEYLRLGLKEMSPESKRQRFQSGKSDFSEKELKFLTEIDYVNHMCFVAYLSLENENTPAGIIRGIRDPHQPNKLEVAVTIIDQFQGRGLGLKLMSELKTWALKNKITHFVGDLHNSNTKMMGLLKKFTQDKNMTTAHVGDGFLYFEIKLD